MTGNPRNDLTSILAWLKRRGYRVEEWDNARASALHKRVKVPRDFWSRPVWSQLRTLRHESVHVWQRGKLGRWRFNLRWTMQPRWRWRLEVQAYRESIAVLYRRVGQRSIAIAEADEIVDRLRRGYLLTFLRGRRNREVTRAMLAEVAL